MSLAFRELVVTSNINYSTNCSFKSLCSICLILGKYTAQYFPQKKNWTKIFLNNSPYTSLSVSVVAHLTCCFQIQIENCLLYLASLEGNSTSFHKKAFIHAFDSELVCKSQEYHPIHHDMLYFTTQPISKPKPAYDMIWKRNACNTSRIEK